MTQHDGGRVPLTVLYGALGLLFVWTVLYRGPMSRDLAKVVFRPSRVVGTPVLVSWPEGIVRFTARDLAERSSPPIEKGDRIVSVDGEPFRSPVRLARQVEAAGTRGRLELVVARKDEHGVERSIASTVRLRSVAEGDSKGALSVLILVMGLLMPWVCIGVGFWVAFVRPRDPVAWLVLMMLLGFSQVAGFQQQSMLWWNDGLRIPAMIFAGIFGATWPIWFPLFGVHFAGRLDWERRHPWVTWVFLGPMCLVAVAALPAIVAEALDVQGALPLAGALEGLQPVILPVAMASTTFFFLVMGWKSSVLTSPDARRRVRLLLWGGTIALTPLLVILILQTFVGVDIDAMPIGLVVPALMLIAIFPLTLAYVILVDKAMDVRVAVRQGLRYAVTRGAIRAAVFLVMILVLWNAWNLVNDPTANRPRKLQAITFGMMAALLLPRAAKRAFAWTDRRFFREAYDAEHILMDLSDEVRTIVETGPLLDTVLDRIGATLHVEKLAVFLHEGDRFIPSRSRGFEVLPEVVFPATDRALEWLTRSGKPLRVRHDDPESPLRRGETITEENRARLGQLDAELVLPLNGKRELLGLITLGPKKSEEPYSITDAKLLATVASQTGLALENSRMAATIVTEVARRERMHREIEIARDVQQKLFPQRIPRIAGLDCAGFCRPAQGVGGDYYDFLALAGGSLGVALGDVAGKGIPAALLMASLQASLRGQRLSGSADLAQLMTNLNYLIYEASPDNRYATFFYGELDPLTRRLDFVNAGHNAPMLFRAAEGRIERLPATGPVVGLLDAGRFEQASVVLDPGDLLVVFSDGISEAMNPRDEEWGEEKLAAAVRAVMPCEARVLIDKLFTAADAFASGATQYDDMTVVVVRVEA